MMNSVVMKILILSTFLSMLVGAKAMTPDDIRALLVTIKSSFGHEVTNQGRSLGDAKGCHAEEARIYEDTSIAPTEFLTFAFTKLWKNPHFDIQEMFLIHNFDYECEMLGGEVMHVDFKLGSDSDAVLMNNYKVCKPRVCDTYEYLLTKRMVYIFFEPYLKAAISLESKHIPSHDCLNDMVKIYNNPSMKDFAPEAFLANGGAALVEQNGYCDDEQILDENWDTKLCDMSQVQTQPNTITEICESEELGGSIFPLNIVYDSENQHRTFLNYPYCKPSTCSNTDIDGWFDYLLKTNAKKIGGNNNVSIKHARKYSCSEDGNALAVMKKEKKKVLVESCDWLRNRPNSRIDKYCRSKSSTREYQPANKVCPLTCCTCSEGKDDIFLKQITTTDAGKKLKLVTKTCGWLQNVNQETRKYLCNNSLPPFGGYSDAKTICPNTCGVCIN